MYVEFNNIESLLEAVRQDKEANGVDSSTRLRYPIRFVLFDNFIDSYAFTIRMIQEMKLTVESVQSWLDIEFPDIMLTGSKLCAVIENYIRSLNGGSKIITPFSELARFYDNTKAKVFDSMIQTLRTIETNNAGWENRQRIYIPIVGLEGKMSTFFNDPQAIIWYQKTENYELNYRLLLTNKTTYGVKNLESQYTIINNVSEWLHFWKDQDAHGKPLLLCTSGSIFANARYAQPDNAFSYCIVDNVYDFITVGLGIDSIDISYKESDEPYWKELATELDLQEKFDFGKFFANHFSISVVNTVKNFIDLWFKYSDEFSRWLLTHTYAKQAQGTFLGDILKGLNSYSNSELFSAIALHMPSSDVALEERLLCLKEAAKRSVKMTDEVATKLCKKLEVLAHEGGYNTAIKLFTPATDKEKELAIYWLGKGLITVEDIKHFYTDLYYYLQPAFGTMEQNQTWVLDYINYYKRAKIADTYTQSVAAEIKKRNGDTVKFLTWKNQFKTTRAHLQSRGDIEVFFWIDGLGIDWIPLIKHFIEERSVAEKIYLNDVKIACAQLPTCTAINRIELEKLGAKEGVIFEKIGDIDTMAHQSTNIYPYNIINELDAVRDIINQVITKYVGKKIAIVSDHGLTYLSQLQQGIGLSGYDYHHYGRYATIQKGVPTIDENYFKMEDNKTVLALNHHSLGNKIQSGLGAHGGCTPEEVLVPIIIISASPGISSHTVQWLDDELSATNPIVHLSIKGLTTMEVPLLEYNGKDYHIKCVDHDLYESDVIEIVDTCDNFSLKIGDILYPRIIPVNTGAKEDDLFADFGF